LKRSEGNPNLPETPWQMIDIISRNIELEARLIDDLARGHVSSSSRPGKLQPEIAKYLSF